MNPNLVTNAQNAQEEQKAAANVVVAGKVGGENKNIKLAILIASIGLILFIIITVTFSFKEPIFSALFPKPASQAASNENTAATSSATPKDEGSKESVDKIEGAPKIASESAFADSKKVFLTSTIHDGNLGGLEGADELCNQRAAVNALTGTWKAWLSDNTTSAKERMMPFKGPYKLVDGTTVARNFNDLSDGNILVPIDLNEYGVKASWSVWTNTEGDGEVSSTDSCKNWTSNSEDSGRVGSTSYSDKRWSSYSTSTCNYTRRLYCIEQ